jgi:hypothetical protein
MTSKEKNKSMVWVIFAIAAALSWGVYGAMLHQGQRELGNPLRALLCVGVAYFLIGVLIPVAGLAGQGQLSLNGFTTGRNWRRLHHLGVQERWHPDLCHAAGVWRRASDQRFCFDGAASTQKRGQSPALFGSDPGGRRREHGALFPPAILIFLDHKPV